MATSPGTMLASSTTAQSACYSNVSAVATASSTNYYKTTSPRWSLSEIRKKFGITPHQNALERSLLLKLQLWNAFLALGNAGQIPEDNTTHCNSSNQNHLNRVGSRISPFCRICSTNRLVSPPANLPRKTSQITDAFITLDFPLVAAKQLLKARVVFWRPVNPDAQAEDIAGLELENSPPQTAQPARLITSDDLWGHPFRVLGFPTGQPNGVWAAGILRGRGANVWVQLEDVKQPGYRLEPGFSGAPIWDEELQGVAGIAVAVEMNRPETKAAFMIPTHVLVKAWSYLNLRGHTDYVNSLSWSRLDGSYVENNNQRVKGNYTFTLASGSSDGTVKLWRYLGAPPRWDLFKTFQAHGSGVNSVSWNPDGKTLISLGDNNTERLQVNFFRKLFRHKVEFYRKVPSVNIKISKLDKSSSYTKTRL